MHNESFAYHLLGSGMFRPKSISSPRCFTPGRFAPGRFAPKFQWVGGGIHVELYIHYIENYTIIGNWTSRPIANSAHCKLGPLPSRPIQTRPIPLATDHILMQPKLSLRQWSPRP